MERLGLPFLEGEFSLRCLDRGQASLPPCQVIHGGFPHALFTHRAALWMCSLIQGCLYTSHITPAQYLPLFPAVTLKRLPLLGACVLVHSLDRSPCTSSCSLFWVRLSSPFLASRNFLSSVLYIYFLTSSYPILTNISIVCSSSVFHASCCSSVFHVSRCPPTTSST